VSTTTNDFFELSSPAVFGFDSFSCNALLESMTNLRSLLDETNFLQPTKAD
jgi:hypothetical protein